MDASRLDPLEELPEFERDSRSGGLLLDLFDARHPYLIVRKVRTSYFWASLSLQRQPERHGMWRDLRRMEHAY